MIFEEPLVKGTSSRKWLMWSVGTIACIQIMRYYNELNFWQYLFALFLEPHAWMAFFHGCEIRKEEKWGKSGPQTERYNKNCAILGFILLSFRAVLRYGVHPVVGYEFVEKSGIIHSRNVNTICYFLDSASELTGWFCILKAMEHFFEEHRIFEKLSELYSENRTHLRGLFYLGVLAISGVITLALNAQITVFTGDMHQITPVSRGETLFLLYFIKEFTRPLSFFLYWDSMDILAHEIENEDLYLKKSLFFYLFGLTVLSACGYFTYYWEEEFAQDASKTFVIYFNTELLDIIGWWCTWNGFSDFFVLFSTPHSL